MPDGTLLHLRDTYPIETAWAPQWAGDELRQVRSGAWHARLAGLRAAADAHAARRHGHHDQAAEKKELAASYQALHDAYRQRETIFATVMADRADWDTATRQQRHLAVAADAELRRRHPGQQFPPLRSAEPEPATQAQREIDRQSQMIPAEDPDYGDLGPAFPAWTGPGKDAILQPPKPEIPPSPYILQRAADRDADREAAD